MYQSTRIRVAAGEPSKVRLEEALRAVLLVVGFALLTALGAQVRIPIQPVPITLQTFFVLLGGLMLGPNLGALAQVLYVSLGAAGAPVFAGEGVGLAYLLGPTGGYLLGFAASAWLVGQLSRALDVRPGLSLDLARRVNLWRGSILRPSASSGRAEPVEARDGRQPFDAAQAGAHEVGATVERQAKWASVPRPWRLLGVLAAGIVAVYVPGVIWLALVTGMGLGKAVVVGALPFVPGDVLKALLAASIWMRLPR
jgi:biotin transporter BioY